jgi:hypothetical protein
MIVMRMRSVFSLATGFLAGTAPYAVLAQDIGLVGAVNQTSQGTPPGRPPRMLNLGNNVIFKERIETSKVGSLQVAFVDKSTVSLGPDSNVVLDEYLYDPSAKTGKMLLTLGKGALRFVGGEISHQGNVEVRTPVGTVGVRGGAFTLTYDPGSKALRIVSNYGRLTISNAQGTQVINRPGYVSTMSSGGPPTPPQRAGGADFDRPTMMVGSQPGQNGGAPRPPTDPLVQTVYTDPTSRTPPATVPSQAGNTSQTTTRTATAPPPPPDTQPTTRTAQTAVTTQAAQTTATGGQGTSTATTTVKTDAAVVATAVRQAAAAATQLRTALAQVAAAAATAAANASTDPNAAVSRAAALQAAQAAQAALAQADTDLARAIAALAQVEALLARLQAATSLTETQAAAAELVSAANTVLSAFQSIVSQNAIAQARALDVNALVTASLQAARLVPAKVFALDGTASAGSAFPFLTSAFVASGNSSAATVTPMLGYRNQGTVSADGFTVTPGVTRTLLIGFSLNGTGSSQSSNALVATGSFEAGQSGTGNAMEFIGGFFGSGRTSATNGPSFAAGAITGTNGTISVDADGIPSGLTVDPQSLAGGLIQPSNTGAQQFGYLPGNVSGSYTFSQSGTGVTPPAGLGQDRAAVTLKGYVSGSLTSTQLSTVPNANGLFPFISGSRQDYQFAGLTGTPDDLVMTFDPSTSTVRATVKIQSVDPASRLASAIYQLGSDAANEAGRRSTYIDNKVFALRHYNGSGALSTATMRTSAVETINSGNRQLMFPWSAVVATNPNANAQYFPGVTICDCAYTQWGFWSVNATHNSNADMAHLNPWVAGQLASPGQIPNSTSATYTGHAIASINNAGSVYLAAGNVSHQVNFATATGSGSISNLDGRSYTINSALVGGTVNFTGTLTAANMAGTLKGSFYGPGTPPVEMGGQFGLSSVSGPAYSANGVFLGKR